MKFAYAESGGLLYMTDGFGRVLRWNGRDTAAVNAGVDPPTTAVTLTFSGRGAIVGTYSAYVRFLDALGNFSNLGPVSTEATAENAGGTVTGASNETPIVITTSAAHGLMTGDTVKIDGVGGNLDADGVWAVTVLSSTTFELDGSSGGGDYDGGGTWSSGVDTVTYTNVPLPTDPKVTIRQILRNTDGQSDVFYVDVETTDMSSTSFSSTRDDEELSAQEAAPLLDDLGDDLAQSHDVPPQTKIALAFNQDRMFYAGEEDYTAGSCKVTNGSTTVTGVGTDWNDSLATRFFYVDGSRTSYEISSVTDADTLVLASPYLGATDNFATYAIRSATFEEKQVLYSEAGLPESVPPRNGLDIRQNGDRIRGIYASGPYVYVVEDRHMHRIIMGEDPLRDSGIFPAAERGVVNHRCWALNEGRCFMLDEQGCHVADDNGDKSISAQIQDVFRKDGRPSYWRVNWAARDHFHCVLHEQQDTVRFFVALAGCSRPRHSLAYNFRLERWWIEEWPRPISASCVGRIDGKPVVFLGSDARTVVSFNDGVMDFVSSSGPGTKRGTVTSSTITSITDTTAEFESTLLGTHLYIVDRTGRGQSRRITAVTDTTLSVQYPWITLPDSTSVYQCGGVKWRWRSKKFRLPETDKTTTTGVNLLFEPTEQAATMDIQLFKDFSKSANVWRNAMTSAGGNQLRTDAGESRFTVDMTKDLGHVSKRFDRKKVRGLDAPRYGAVQLSGVTNEEPVAVLELVIDGMV